MGFASFDFQGSGVGTSSGEYEFNCGASSSRGGVGSRGGSGRQKPRLVKVRRAVNSSRSGLKNPDSGFNPFRLSSERVDSIDGGGKLGGDSRPVGFVFGASNSLQDLISTYSGVGDVEKENTCNDIYNSNVGGRNESLGLDHHSEQGGKVGVSLSEDKLRRRYDPDCEISDGVTKPNLRFRDSVVGVHDGDQARGREAKVGQGSSSGHFNGIKTGKVSSGKLDDGGLVFGASVSDSVANSSREGFAGPSTVSEIPSAGKCVGSSVKVEENTEVSFDRDVRQDVMFGATVSESGGNGTLKREDIADDVRENNFVFGESESRKADGISFNASSGETLNLEKGQRWGVFVFGSANEPNNPSLGSPSAKISDPVGRPLYDDGAHVKDRVETASSSETYSKVDLPFEFKKLHIKTPKDASPTDTSENSDASKHAGADGLFMFTSSSEDRVSSTENTTASQEQSNETDSLGKSNIFIFGSCKNTFGSSGPNVKAVAENVVKDLNSNTEERILFGSGVSFDGSSDMDRKNPFFSASLSFSVDLSHGLNRKGESSVKSRFSKKHKSKKTRQKLAQLNLDMGQCTKEPISSESNPEEPGDSTRCYSPMDVSPRGNIGTETPAVEETSAPSGFPFMDLTPTDAQCATAYVAKVDELYAAHLLPTAFCMSSTAGGTSEETGFSTSSNIPARDDEGRTQFCSSDLAGGSDKLFAFTASTSDQAQATSVRRQGKKYRRKIAHVSRAVSSTCDQPLNISLLSNGLHDENEQNPALKGEEQQRSEASLEKGNLSELTSAEKACDKWRLRGNQAYKAGEMSQAEDLYTRGLNCVPSLEMPGLNMKPLVLCYNNRAAARMGLGKVRDALGDCLLAISCDPEFHKARIRAGNCHLMLGEVELAMQHFNRILESANGVCLDRQVMFAASEGIQKGQKVMNHMSRSAELIKIKTSEATTEALSLITEALLICPHSERLLEMKAKTLCLLRKYMEAIHLCDQSFAFAEKNFAGGLPERQMEGGSGCPEILDVKSWRQDIVVKCHFHLGRLDSVVGRLQKQGCGTDDQELLHPLVATIRELQKHKNAGNEAFQSGKHAEAVVHYTSAISSSTESRPFAAICFCNRAAAYQALGQITDAIADCCLAIALDENYPKALSRRATLHEMIRDYNQAADDLQKVVSILEKKAPDKEESGSKSDKELRQVRRRLSSVESEAKKGIPLDLYLILGVKRSDPAAEIKKAYRKAALRHHPDKACQALVRSEGGDDGQLWKDIADLVHKDSDKLFKIIGEAYQVLSDPEKRSEYDLAEDMRNKKTDVYRNSPRRDSSTHNMYSPFTRSSTRRHSYRTYYWSYDDD
ncbi:hypothetical protein Drorol1_Dr00015386 [Drosera rotundifolia]